MFKHLIVLLFFCFTLAQLQLISLPSTDFGQDCICSQLSCRGLVNRYAHQWTAGVRNVTIHLYYEKDNSLFVEFVAAPPYFCFEQYEVQLYVEKMLLQRALIGKEGIYYEPRYIERENRTVYIGYGNFTFENLKDGIYDVGIIPVAHSGYDNRCLCPMEEGHGCSCTLAKWPHIVLQRQH